MDIEAIIPKILFIRGVFKRDCVTDDIFEKKILENIDPYYDDIDSYNNTTYINYSKLPQIFYNLETWPDHTNLLCWYCTLNFDSPPIFIPKIIEPNINKIERLHKLSIGVYGVFCSFGCAYNFIVNRKYNIIDTVEDINKLKYLYKIFTTKTIMPEYNSYPSPYEMIQYGGDLTIENFKEKIKKWN